MAPTTKKYLKLKRVNPMEVSGFSNPKVMYLLPSNYIETSNMSNLSVNSGIQKINGRLTQLFNTNNKQYKIVESTEYGAQKCSTPSLPNEDGTSSEMVEVDESVLEDQQYELNSDDEFLEEEYIEEDDEIPKNDDVILNEQNEEIRQPHGALCCIDCREDRKRFESLILRKINRLLLAQESAHPVEREERGHQYLLLPPMPFNDINALRLFDDDLKNNPQIRNKFIQKIKDIGGKTVQKVVKFSMEAVITDELAQQVVWTLGAENVPKISKFTFPYLIINIVRDTFVDTKIKAVEDRIADWLRRGGDRIKGVMLAANKRRERAQYLQQ